MLEKARGPSTAAKVGYGAEPLSADKFKEKKVKLKTCYGSIYKRVYAASVGGKIGSTLFGPTLQQTDLSTARVS